ncbi:MAG: L-arabinose isomerase [Bacteroidales bacterium]|nr:L-arabinose isomerase [Bacteroidales bacterium]
MAKAFENMELWWITGAQLLYGGETVQIVDGHSKEMVEGLNNGGIIPVKVVYKGTANSSNEVEAIMQAASNDPKCAGVITWMHTFSPAKMWIKGLQCLKKPLLHFHTQYNSQIPWESIDMDFMNLNQSAHGDIEFGHICSRMRVARKVVVGHWKSKEAQERIAVWARVAAAVADAHDVRCLMFGMNMNNVAVTDGDRVEFEQRLGYHVDYYPVSSLMEYFKKVEDADVEALVEEYRKLYTVKIDECGEQVYWEKVRNAAKAEIAIRRVLEDENTSANTTNFDDLGAADITAEDFCGFDQIPGLATQRLMAEGYGFGAEGDWKTACLQRSLWVMNQGFEKGCSFLEDYTLNFAEDCTSSLQSHMLEVCPLISSDKPKLEVHFLGIGIRKQQTARLVFTSKTGRGIKATIVDLGNRFRLITSEVECIEPKPMPKLPVASALWVPQPTFEIGAGAWILAGGTHHSAFSYDITAEYWEDFAEITGMEFIGIDKNTTISGFKQQLRNNEVYYMLNKALK